MTTAPLKKTALDKDLGRLARFEQGLASGGQGIAKAGVGLLFLIAVWILATVGHYEVSFLPTYANSAFVVAAAVIGGYMALNIGANDVANNVGPAVGSKALTLFGALLIAAVFEAGGAIIAGGDVVSTIKNGIIDPSLMPSADVFVKAMMAALLAAALWLNLATAIGAPVSTTHSIVGGVMGAGIAATGFSAVNWGTMGAIAASWVISPVMGGVIAAAFLAFIKIMILSQPDKLARARRWVPVLIAIMCAVFSSYLMMKGLKKIWKVDAATIALVSGAVFVLAWAATRPLVARAAAGLENRRKAVSSLFTIPLILSAALLSFAHGANDVANAVGPLAAIVDSAQSGIISTKVGIPLWVMLVGAVGIAAGLILFGPRLIRTVGQEITKLDRTRAFCVALAAAITVILASALGLPVSSTHIAVGGIFGVGFLREYLSSRPHAAPVHKDDQAAFANVAEDPEARREKIRRKIEKAQRRKLVRRSHMLTIGAAWVITVPLAALLFYFMDALIG
ncbi:MAG: inorganic phosphate transporter [Rhodobacterales bacterium]|nr:inorganic phosphate transporter [Rhodobacterales bacterium]